MSLLIPLMVGDAAPYPSLHLCRFQQRRSCYCWVADKDGLPYLICACAMAVDCMVVCPSPVAAGWGTGADWGKGIFFGITHAGDTSSPAATGYGAREGISSMTLLDSPFLGALASEIRLPLGLFMSTPVGSSRLQASAEANLGHSESKENLRDTPSCHIIPYVLRFLTILPSSFHCASFFLISC